MNWARDAGHKARSFSLRSLLMMAAGGLSAPAQPVEPLPLSREYQVKAAFLFNFAKYGAWPAERLLAAPFRFCISAHAELVDSLAERLKDARIHELAVDVVLLKDEPVASCHLLFIPEAVAADQQQALIAAATNKAVLIMGEASGFLDNGGMVRFFIASGTVHFDVHLERLQQQGLQLSSKLLRLADQIHGKHDEVKP
jgi:hypothetical protein